MCIEFLHHLSRVKAPLTLTDPAEINNLMVLRAAGLVAAFTLRSDEQGQVREWGRFLALTPEGRAVLDHSAKKALDDAGESDAADQPA